MRSLVCSPSTPWMRLSQRSRSLWMSTFLRWLQRLTLISHLRSPRTSFQLRCNSLTPMPHSLGMETNITKWVGGYFKTFLFLRQTLQTTCSIEFAQQMMFKRFKILFQYIQSGDCSQIETSSFFKIRTEIFCPRYWERKEGTVRHGSPCL